MTRVEKLQAMLTARTDGEGKPMLGYRDNVEHLKREIARLSGN